MQKVYKKFILLYGEDRQAFESLPLLLSRYHLVFVLFCCLSSFLLVNSWNLAKKIIIHVWFSEQNILVKFLFLTETNSPFTRLIFSTNGMKLLKNLNTVFTLVLNIYSLFTIQNKGWGHKISQHWKSDTYLIKLTHSWI